MNNNNTILWIHGFAGCPNNVHVQEMRKRYPQYTWHSIEVDHHALASMEKINNFILTNDVCLVAGTSLGGYYAMCSDFDGPKLVVNPVTDPKRDLRQFLGKNSYKPGRPDGQTEFEFTEEMLTEFGLLTHDKLYNVLCHYTPHDQLLGEDIKKEYEKTFYFLEMIDEKTLPEHFMTFKYVKYMESALSLLIENNSLSKCNFHNRYLLYTHLPQSIVPPLMITYFSDNEHVNWLKLLDDVEVSIKDTWKQHYGSFDRKGQNALKDLFSARKRIMQNLFTPSQESLVAFRQINDNLDDMQKKMVKKMMNLYSAWIKDEEQEWRNDCNLSGRILVEQTKESFPDDGTGSDYEWMMEKIEFIRDKNLIDIFLCCTPETTPDQILLEIENLTKGKELLFNNEFMMCYSFEKLYNNTLYAPQDILRIKHYWCEVALTHQRITNENGELQ